MNLPSLQAAVAKPSGAQPIITLVSFFETR